MDGVDDMGTWSMNTGLVISMIRADTWHSAQAGRLTDPWRA